MQMVFSSETGEKREEGRLWIAKDFAFSIVLNQGWH